MVLRGISTPSPLSICVTLASLWYFEERKNSTIYLASFFFAMEYLPYIIKDKFRHKFYSTINQVLFFPTFLVL